MAKVTYLGEDENSNAPVTWLGHTFKPGEAVEVTHPHLLSKAEGNPFFEVEGGEDLPNQDTPYGKGYYAKLEGRKKSVPVFYRGKTEADDWLRGFDAAPAPEPDAPEADPAGGGTMSTGVQPGVSLAP